MAGAGAGGQEASRCPSANIIKKKSFLFNSRNITTPDLCHSNAERR